MVETTRVPAIDYTSRDFEAFRQDMIRLVPFFNPEWTDLNASDFGVTVIEALSYGLDITHYYIDRMNSESYLTTAVTPQAVLAIVRQLGYIPRGPSPARVTLDFTVPTAATVTSDYVIPARTLISTGEVDFETDEDLTIPVGGTTGSVAATEGLTVGFAAPAGESLGDSDGLPFANFTLARGSVISNTVKVYVDEADTLNYIEYLRVESFVEQSSTARVFRLIKLGSGQVSVVFGDGINGKTPPTNAPVQAAYRIGGGLVGNVGTGTLTTVSSTLSGGFAVTVNNAEAAAGGDNGDSIADAKEQAILNIRALDRAVTLDDYAALAVKNTGVATAKARFNDSKAAVEVALSSGTGIPTATIQAEVLKYIQDRDGVGLGTEIIDPTLISIDLTATVTVGATASRAGISALIDAEFDTYFTIGPGSDRSNFSVDVFESDVTSLIDNIDGVDHIDVGRLTRVPNLLTDSWVATGYSVTALVGPTNLIEQTYTITLPIDLVQGTSGLYTVSGSVTGLETSQGTYVWSDGTGTDGIAYTSQGANTDIQLTVILPQVSAILAGTAVAPQPGDQIQVKVGRYRGNQTMTDFEIRRKGTFALTVTGGVV